MKLIKNKKVVKLTKNDDVRWLFNRLDHLLFIYENPESCQAGLGPDETMAAVKTTLPYFMKKYKFKRCWDE